MGVRLTIKSKTDEMFFYGSKLYGYVGDLTGLKSLRYLWEIKGDFLTKERGYENFEEFAELMDVITHCDNLCELSIPELTEFLRLYDEDLQHCGREYTISDEALSEIPKGVELVWIEWG